MRRHRLLPLHLLVVLGLVFAACGDDDGSDVSAEGDDSADVEDDGSADLEDDAEDAVRDELESEAGGECGFLASFADAFADLDPSEGIQQGETIDFGALFGNLADEFQEVADAAPEEIREDFQTMAGAVDEVATQLEGVEIDFSDPENIDEEAFAQLQSIDTVMDEEVDAAGEEIDSWISQNCGEVSDEIDLEGLFGP